MEIGIMKGGRGGLAGLDARGGAMGRIMIFLTQVRSILPGPDDMSVRARELRPRAALTISLSMFLPHQVKCGPSAES